MMQTIAALADDCATISKSKGWYDSDRKVAEELALIHSEISEALEEVRNGVDLGEIRYRESDGKPEGFVVELADAVIRILDTAAMRVGSERFAQALDEKMAFNITRPYRHGGKAL